MTTRCTCDFTEDLCDGELEPDDPRCCRHCLELDSEYPCPADTSVWADELEATEGIGEA